MLKGFLRRRADLDIIRHEKLMEIARNLDATVILFGSRSKGTYTPASDFDLLVIYDDSKTVEELRHKLREHGIPADVHYYTLSEALDLMKSSTLILDALEEGLVLRGCGHLKVLREKMKKLKEEGYRKVEGGWILGSSH